jgi:hypothetical protein
MLCSTSEIAEHKTERNATRELAAPKWRSDPLTPHVGLRGIPPFSFFSRVYYVRRKPGTCVHGVVSVAYFQ